MKLSNEQSFSDLRCDTSVKLEKKKRKTNLIKLKFPFFMRIKVISDYYLFKR